MKDNLFRHIDFHRESIADFWLLTVGKLGSGCRGFFPITSFASHSCCNNTFHKRKPRDDALKDYQDLPLGEVISETRAKDFIPKGNEITLHYTGGLKGRIARRKLLEEGWFFTCLCERCSSKDELGTHCSTLICKGCLGNLLPVCPADIKSDYKCSACSEVRYLSFLSVVCNLEFTE